MTARLWMGVALGSVLVVGLSAGLLADRLLAERGGAETKGAAEAPAHAARSSAFHFDCRDREESPAGAANVPAPEAGADAGAEPAESEAFLEHRSKMTHRMARRLELDPEQIEALEPIVGEAMVRGRLYWTGARDEFCAMQRDFHRQVGELLRPDQAERFDEMRQDLWRRGGHRGDRDRDGRDGHGRRDERGHRGDRADDGSPGECR